MKLSEYLAQPTVELTHGDVLKSITRSEGYVPTRKDTDALHLGQYHYKVLGIGSDIGAGKYAAYKIVPVIVNAQGTALVDDVANPIIVQEAGKVTYMTGRNHPEYKDAYNGNQFHEVKGITVGQEARHALLAFIDFVNSEFSLGVNDFQIGTPEK